MFRDRLRASADLRARYAAVEARAAALHPHDREAYGRAETDVVELVVTGER